MQINPATGKYEHHLLKLLGVKNAPLSPSISRFSDWQRRWNRHGDIAAASRHRNRSTTGVRRPGGGVWSPESLLCAAGADCFILTFRGVSRAAKFEWLSLECRVQGTLERVDAKSLFTKFAPFATLKVAAGSDIAKARSLLDRAEHGCLIANSLLGTRSLEAEVVEATNG